MDLNTNLDDQIQYFSSSEISYLTKPQKKKKKSLS